MNIEHFFLTAFYIILSCSAFSALAAFIVTFIKTLGAFSALSTIVGTSVGFLAAAYIPVGTLPSGVVNVLNCFPFSQAAMLFRKPITHNSLNEMVANVGQGRDVAVNQIDSFYGMTLFVGDWEIPSWCAVAMLVAMIIIFSVLATWKMGKKIR